MSFRSPHFEEIDRLNNPNGITVPDVRKYLHDGRQGFAEDPPADAFQRGFKAAVDAMWEDLFMTADQRKLSRSKAKGEG